MPTRPPSISPASIPRRAKVVLVYGGSFDPPHRAHAVIPLLLAQRLYGPAGHVLYIPAARSPLKETGPVAADEDRVRMLALALGRPATRPTRSRRCGGCAGLSLRG